MGGSSTRFTRTQGAFQDVERRRRGLMERVSEFEQSQELAPEVRSRLLGGLPSNPGQFSGHSGLARVDIERRERTFERLLSGDSPIAAIQRRFSFLQQVRERPGVARQTLLVAR